MVNYLCFMVFAVFLMVLLGAGCVGLVQQQDPVVPRDPQTAEEWMNKGDIQVSLGKYPDALQSYDQALSVDPGNAAAWNRKRNVYAAMGRYEAAADAKEQACRLNPAFCS